MTSRADRLWTEQRGLASRVARHDVATCESCGLPMAPMGNRGHLKRFCDDACRAAAYRRRRAGLPENLPALANDHGRLSLADRAPEIARFHGLPDSPAHITPTSHSTSQHKSSHAPAGRCP